ncbi:DoxX family protein [Muriicola sp.]|uniref:DoxX family protein n=2 Tax=Muriicola sp. TaxID=2020856 RepID=UPI003563A136
MVWIINMKQTEILGLFLAFSFLIFGISCLFAPKMKKEFERYRLADKRRLTGILQLLGSAGLFFGIYLSAALSLTASAGLALLMLFGVIVRIRIRDPWPAVLPALFYALLSAYLFYDLLDF